MEVFGTIHISLFLYEVWQCVCHGRARHRKLTSMGNSWQGHTSGTYWFVPRRILLLSSTVEAFCWKSRASGFLFVGENWELSVLWCSTGTWVSCTWGHFGLELRAVPDAGYITLHYLYLEIILALFLLYLLFTTLKCYTPIIQRKC